MNLVAKRDQGTVLELANRLRAASHNLTGFCCCSALVDAKLDYRLVVVGERSDVAMQLVTIHRVKCVVLRSVAIARNR